VGGGAVVGLIDRDVSGRHRAEHLEDEADRRVVAVPGVRPAQHRVDGARQAHALAQRSQLVRQRLLQVAVPVEHVGQRPCVERRETARESRGRAHRA
jgi:hypothetical protein